LILHEGAKLSIIIILPRKFGAGLSLRYNIGSHDAGGFTAMSYIISEEVLEANPRVFIHSAGGGRVVVKRRAKPDRIFVHVFQNTLARLLREPMMLRTDDMGSGEWPEAKKLRALRENGLSVPEVLYETGNYFVLEYVGRNLGDVLTDESDPDKKRAYVESALLKLRSLHDKHFIHGGSQIKNFTVRDGEIYIIDFEEVIPPEYFEEFRIRDLILFAMSLEKEGLPFDLGWLCEVYGGLSDVDVRRRLEDAVLKYRFLKFLSAGMFSWISMDDVRAAVALIKKAERARLNAC
jgi:tRNA A-37 threonylcarbamoyl transferase component Bud32